MKMLRLCLCLIFCWTFVQPAGLQAETLTYPWFQLDLPPHWQAAPAREVGQSWSLQLSQTEGLCQVSILVGKLAGQPDARDVAGLLRAASSVQEAPRRVEGHWLFSGKDSMGTDVHCVVTGHAPSGLYLAVLIHGTATEARPLLQSLTSSHHAALLPPQDLLLPRQQPLHNLPGPSDKD